MSSLSLVILLSLIFTDIGTVHAKKKEVVVNTGYLLHRITFENDYGEFLKRRYNVDHLDFRGPRIMIAYEFFDQLSFGLEFDMLSGEFKYDSLNSITHKAEFEFTQIILKVHYQFKKFWNAELGYGINTLSRTMYGYEGYYISEEIFANSDSSATDESMSSVYVLGIIYKRRGEVFGWKMGEKYGWELGVRYIQSSHALPADSKRPGLDLKGSPEDQNFDLSGLGYHVALMVYF